MLSPEERVEYDELMYEAGFDEFGNLLPSSEIGARAVALLQDAVRAGRTWAGFVLDDALEAGCLSRWQRWKRERNKIRTVFEGRTVPLVAVSGLRRRDVGGEVYHQQSFWPDMSAEELHQIISDSRSRVLAERVRIASALRLLELMEVHGASTVGEALAAEGMSLADFLGAESAA